LGEKSALKLRKQRVLYWYLNEKNSSVFTKKQKKFGEKGEKY